MCPPGCRSCASSRWRGFAALTTSRCEGSRPLLLRDVAVNPLGIELLQSLDHGTAACELAAVDLAHRNDPGESACHKRLVSTVDVGQREILLDRNYPRVARD